MFSGLLHIIVALLVRFPHWGWLVLHGVINLLLGIAIRRRWPWDGLWVIGLFIGIDMIFNGWSLVMLGLSAKKLPYASTRAGSSVSRNHSFDETGTYPRTDTDCGPCGRDGRVLG